MSPYLDSIFGMKYSHIEKYLSSKLQTDRH